MPKESNILEFCPRKPAAKALVVLSHSFSEQTNRPIGLEGKLRGYDPQNPAIALVDIGETFPVKVHAMDYTIIG